VIDMRHPDLQSPRPPRSRTLARSAWSAVGCLASLAAAQEPPESRLGRVDITGSRLSQLEIETALPVVVIRREQIERSGATTAEELLTRLSASVHTDKEAGRIGTVQSPGYSGLSIRGFFGAGTLILVGGTPFLSRRSSVSRSSRTARQRSTAATRSAASSTSS
jgi:iron complex outermembrane receptor protein